MAAMRLRSPPPHARSPLFMVAVLCYCLLSYIVICCYLQGNGFDSCALIHRWRTSRDIDCRLLIQCNGILPC